MSVRALTHAASERGGLLDCPALSYLRKIWRWRRFPPSTAISVSGLLTRRPSVLPEGLSRPEGPFVLPYVSPWPFRLLLNEMTLPRSPYSVFHLYNRITVIIQTEAA